MLFSPSGEAGAGAGAWETRTKSVGGLWQLSAIDGVKQGIDEKQQALSASVDDPSILQYGQHLRRAGKGIMALSLPCFERRNEVGTAVGGSRCTFGNLTHHGENGAFDRPLDGSIGRLSSHRKGLRPDGCIFAAGPALGADRVGKTAQDLRHDDARVAPSAHERTVADGLADFIDVGGSLELGADGLERERHVRAGVTIGHRVDVEGVDHFLVTYQQVTERPNRRSDLLRAKSLGHRHGRNRRRVTTELNPRTPDSPDVWDGTCVL